MAIWFDPEDAELNSLLALAGDLSQKQILEVGCGNGRLTWRYAAQAIHVHAIDPVEEKITTAQAAMPDALSPQVTLHATGLLDFTAPHLFDLVLLSWSL